MICIACFVIIKKDYGDEYLILIVSMLFEFWTDDDLPP